MPRHKTAFGIATGFFGFWLAILYAGADHPPPPGFLLLVILDLVCAVVVYYRVPVYLGWSRARLAHRLWRALGEGLAAGLAIAVLVMLTSRGEPSVRLTVADRLIWITVVGAVGAANAAVVFLVSTWLARRQASHDGSRE